MLPLEHSAIPSTFIKLLFVIKVFVLSIFERPPQTGSTVLAGFAKKSEASRVFPIYSMWG